MASKIDLAHGLQSHVAMMKYEAGEWVSTSSLMLWHRHASNINT